MGNVHAKVEPMQVPPPTADPPTDIKMEAPKPEASDESHPGNVEELHKQCKDVFPVAFEGAKIIVNKGLSNHFQISHTLNMSSIIPSGYRFGATYVGTMQFCQTEAFPVMLGDIDLSGNLNANVIHQFTPKIKSKMAAQIQDSKLAALQITTDYRGSDYTASLTAANTDVITETGIIIGQYLQSVTKSLALGAELVHQYGPQVPGGGISNLSILGKYTGDSYTVSGTLGSGGAHACYYHKCSEQLKVGVEVETNLRTEESVASVGYQIDLPKSNLAFRGMLDTNWIVGAVLEKKLTPLPFTFLLSGLINHDKNQFRFGCGLLIG
ncbi:Mitochondrial import receptor subunit TOM40 1 [Nymphon striatum]|nr:Mitochondrial import receptor subunit TOM40 1 [Nymphon striatum]